MRSFTTIIGLISLSLVPIAALADSSEWQAVEGGRVRLISASPAARAEPVDAGLEFDLEPGWHIYWRFPGEAGVPTEADFSGSRNIARATLRYPAPALYDDGTSMSVVYTDRVVLPIDVERADPQRPSILEASVRFGVCRDICVPGEAKLTMTLDSNAALDPALQSALADARSRIPRPQTAEPPAIVSVEPVRVAGKKHPVLTITAALSGPEADVTLFAEGAPGSYNEVPRLVRRDGARAVYQMSARGLVNGPGGLPLRLTLVSGGKAVDWSTKVNTP